MYAISDEEMTRYARMYLEHKGYEVAGADDGCGIVCRDGGVTVFVTVRGRGVADADEAERARRVKDGAEYMRRNGLDGAVRFDEIALSRLSWDRLLIKHFANVFSAA